MVILLQVYVPKHLRALVTRQYNDDNDTWVCKRLLPVFDRNTIGHLFKELYQYVSDCTD